MRTNMKGLFAISPMFVFLVLFLLLGYVLGDFSRIPLIVVFLGSSIYALFTMHGVSVEERITAFSKGAGSLNLLLMVWIFVLAGAFAQTTKDMGAINAAVDFTLSIFPVNWLVPCLFLSACLVSLSVGTSVGTIVALVPVAVGIAAKMSADPSLLVASVVGGSFFGDNLSFISDTTVAATRTQECRSLKDKFNANVRIALPAAVITFVLYLFVEGDLNAGNIVEHEEYWKVIPYAFVLLIAIWGVNVLFVLALGIILAGLFSLCACGMSLEAFFISVSKGVLSMGELILISMLAGGLLEIVRRNGGIDYLIRKLSARVKGVRGAEYCMALLVSITNLCTANNTIAILSVGDIARQISVKYGIDRRMGASVLDIFSCVVQGLIPYGAQLLMASGLAGISPMKIIPYLYYPMILGLVTILAIAFKYPRKYYHQS